MRHQRFDYISQCMLKGISITVSSLNAGLCDSIGFTVKMPFKFFKQAFFFFSHKYRKVIFTER